MDDKGRNLLKNGVDSRQKFSFCKKGVFEPTNVWKGSQEGKGNILVGKMMVGEKNPNIAGSKNRQKKTFFRGKKNSLTEKGW